MEQQQAWWDFFRDPNEQNFESIYRLTHRLVYTICYRTLRAHEDALDAFQTTYTRLLMLAREGVDPGVIEDADRLIRRLAVRESDALRKRRGRRSRKEIVMEQIPESPGDHHKSPADNAAERERRAKIEALIETLPDALRMPLLLHYFDGMTHDEIARTLAVPRSTITHRIKKGLRRLEPLLRRTGLAEGPAVLAALLTGAQLLAPQKTIAATSVFASASTAAAVGSGIQVGATGTLSAKAILSASGSGSSALKAASIAILFVAAVSGAIALTNLDLQPLPNTTAPAALAPTPTQQAAVQPTNDIAESPIAEGPTTEIATGIDTANPDPQPPLPAAAPDSEPAPDPETIPINLRFVWEDDKQPVQYVAVTSDDNLEPFNIQSGVTDAKGRVQFMARADSPLQSITAEHSLAVKRGLSFPPPKNNTEQIIPLKRGATISGVIWDRDKKTPLANTPLILMGQMDIENRSYHPTEARNDGSFELSRTSESDAKKMAQSINRGKGIWKPDSAEMMTGDDGSFEITQIHPAKNLELWVGDNYLVAGEKAGNDGQYFFSAQPGESINAGDLSVYPGGIVEGRVTDTKTGEPLRAMLNIGNVFLPGANRTFSDTNGHYKLQRLTPKVHDIEIRGSNHVMQHLAVSAITGKSLHHDIQLRPGAQLTVTVVDETGNPVPKARITQESRDGDFTWFTQRYANEQGVFITHEYDIERRGRVSVSADGYERASALQVPELNDAGTEAHLKVVLRDPADEKFWFAGTVRSAEGKPLQGIRVVFATQLDTSSSDNRTTTDAFGRYQLASNPIDPMRKPVLTAYGKGWAAQSLPSLQPGTEDAPTNADFTLSPGRWLKVHVQDTEGNPIPKAHVYARMPVDNYPDQNYGVSIPAWRNFRTDANGDAELHDLGQDPHIFSVNAPQLTRFEQLETELNRSVTYTVQPAGILRGAVIDAATGDQIPAFRVRLSSTGGVSSDMATTGLSFNDPSGHFEVGELALGGRYTMTVIAEGYSDQVSTNNIAGSRDIEPVRFELIQSNQAHGILLDAATGQPLPGVDLVYGETPRPYGMHVDWDNLTRLDFLRGSGFINLQPLRTDKEGRFSFDKGTNHSYVLANTEPYQPLAQYLGLTFPAKQPLRIEMKQGITLSGQVTFEGKPVEARHMFIQPTGNREEGQLIVMPGSTETDIKGQFSFSRLAPGRYLLDSGTRPAKQGTRYQRELDLEHDTKLDLGGDLGPYHMTGHVLLGDKPLEDVSVVLSPRFTSDFTRFSTRAGKDGQFKLEGLLPGSYRIQVNGGMDAPRQLHQFKETITIDGNITHDIQVALHHELTITIVDANGSPELPSPITGASISHKERQTLQSDNPMQLTDGAAATVQGNTLKFSGRFLGDYNLTLYFEQGEQHTTIPIADPLLLDNLDADTDFGRLNLPPMATARVKIVQSAGDSQPLQRINVAFQPEGTLPNDQQTVVCTFIPQAGVEQQCALIPVGNYNASLRGVGITPDPAHIPVVISPASEPLLEFSLSSMASIFAVAIRPDMDLHNSELKDTIQISRATLTGNGVNITLTGQPIDMNDERAASHRMEELRMDSQSFVLGPVAAFRNLQPGTYQLRIEADGYSPITRDVESIMGEPQPVVFNLEP